jgi:signal transduction histidine kinase/ActR/RegA family two-component response regulator
MESAALKNLRFVCLKIGVTMRNVFKSSANYLPANRWNLRFNGAYSSLESEYRAHFFARYLPLIRTCHWVAIVFYGGFGLLDVYLFPDRFLPFLVIRLAIVCPLFLIGWILTYRPWYHRITTSALMFFVFATGAGYTAMSAMVPAVYNFGYYVGLMACIIFGYTFIRLPVVNATVAGWSVFAIFWLFGIQDNLPIGMATNQVVYLIGLNLLLMTICYIVEHAERKNFYLSRLLEAEKAKVILANASLEETVAIRTRDLQISNENLSKEIAAHKAAQQAKELLTHQLRQAQKMEAIGTMAGGIAHDFNNILGSIMGFTELALDDAVPGGDQHSNLNEVLTAGRRARDLVKQILAFSRRGEQSAHVVSLKQVAQEVHKLLRASLPASIDLELVIDAEPNVLADDSQINQVLMNLAINASQALDDHKGKISIRLGQAALDQSFCDQHPGTAPGEYAMLMVKDNGSGIPDEIIERIFEPFFTTKSQGQGTGLGLSVVHGIVQSHSGAITVKSQLGKGTTFRIYIPLINDLAQEINTEIPDLPQGRERILLIDDERALLQYGRQSLTRLGYKVETRDNSLEALEYFKAHHNELDLVITDLTMPHLSGDALAGEMRKLQPCMPIILCSGLDSTISPQMAKNIGLAAVIGKPVLKADFAGTIRRVLDGAAGRAAIE